MEWLFLYKSRSGAVVARQSHYLKVGSSSLSSATIFISQDFSQWSVKIAGLIGVIAQWKSICFASRGFWVRLPVSPLT